MATHSENALGAARLADARTLAVAILPLFRCRTRGEMLAYLTRQGVVPPEWSGVEPDFAEPEDQEEPDDPAEEIVREIVGALNTNPPSGDYRIPTAGPRPANIEAPAPYVPPTPFVLPAIDEVQLTVPAAANAGITRPVRAAGSGGGSGGSWTPRNSEDVERDRVVGERGEELVYRLELARLRAGGYPDPEKACDLDVAVGSRGGSRHHVCTHGREASVDRGEVNDGDGWPVRMAAGGVREGAARRRPLRTLASLRGPYRAAHG